MTTAGIVAEFNPFHSGHAALIKAARAAGATHVAAVMSGNFTQRGEPAITDKRIRARCALLGGVDLVVELPLPYATATAQKFAEGAVRILAATGCVDMLCFGSESGDGALLQRLASLLEEGSLRDAMAPYLGEGRTFAAARQLAVAELGGEAMGNVLAFPNNALAVEYLAAARRILWHPRLFTIKRQGVHHDALAPGYGFASASYLRGQAENYEALGDFMEPGLVEELRRAAGKGLYPACFERLATAELARLRMISPGELALLPDLSEGLENRFYHAIRASASLSELMNHTKTKRYTLARVRRLVLHAFLGVERRDLEVPPPYIRVLGFNERGRELLAGMKEASLPVDVRLARLKKIGGECHRFAALEDRATDLYTLCLPKPRACGYELRAPGVYL